MKLAFSAFAAVGVLGVLPYVIHNRTSEEGALAGQSLQTPVSYQLRVTGREGHCTVVKHDTRERRTELEMSGECAEMMPRLADVRYWQEDDAGGVIFAAADGRPVVEFFAADGVAYESLRPAAPLMALTAQ